MQTWHTLRPQFADALADAFDKNGLERLLQTHCEKPLTTLTSIYEPVPKQIADIITNAVRTGWLDCLVHGATADNPTNIQLNAVAPQILAGIAAKGPAFYQSRSRLQRDNQNDDDLETTPVRLDDLRPYLEWMQRRSRNLPLGPFDPSGRDSELIGLNDVFVALDVDRAEEARLTSGEPGAYSAAIAHLHDQAQLILLGDPGSGKSTLLRYLAFCLCNAWLEPEGDWLSRLQWVVKSRDNTLRQRRKKNEEAETHTWQTTGLVPIFIQLRDFARQAFDCHDQNAIWHYVISQLPAQLHDTIPALEQLALQGQLYFMFDGVDEVPPHERQQVWQAIGAFLRSPFGGNRWVATCRVLSYDEAELPRRHLPVVTLRQLDQTQIDHFITNWYRALAVSGELGDGDAEHKTQALQAASRGHLHELATNPMLLTIMAIVQTYEGTLPDERALLYQRCVETLLLRWQRAKDEDDENAKSIVHQLETTQAQLEQLLWRLGWEAHAQATDREGAADLPEWDVLRIAKQQLGSYAKAERFLEYTEKKAHLLVGIGGGRERRFTFPHRTFQEYLAACYLESERKPLRRIKRLAEAGDAWREVLNLAFGRLMHVKNDRIKAIDIVSDRLLEDELPDDEAGWRRVWLTGEVCAVIGQEALQEDEEGAELLPQVRAQLVALLVKGALTPRQRAEAGTALSALGDPRRGVCTLEPDLIPIPTGDFFYGDEKETRTIEQPFAIARYPTTNAQYRFFVEDGGYSEKWQHCWTDAGWEWKESEGWREPRYWDDAEFNQDNQPVVGISWFEAVAYCHWLTAVTGKPYRLPTEIEWERAARHTDGRTYPWSEQWDNGIVNSREARLNQTTAIGAFPQSTAQCGAHDMSGNAMEWCAGDDDHLPLRGGSWRYTRYGCRAVSRYYDHPRSRDGYVGVRLVMRGHPSQGR